MYDKILILDCETTGVSNYDEVIQLAYIEIDSFDRYRKKKFVPRLSSEMFNEYYKPNVQIHPNAQAVHGLNFQRLFYKKSTNLVLEDLPEVGKGLLVGHQISFDKRMLKLGQEWEILDTLSVVRNARKQGILSLPHKSNKLDDLISSTYPELVGNKYHNAIDDVKKVEVLLHQLFQIPGIDSLDKLFILQNL